MTAITRNADTSVRDVVMVFKPRIALAIMLSAIGGMSVASDPLSVGLGQLAVVAIAVFLAAASAGAFNQWVERDLDACMRRTSGRPFVTGQFKADGIWMAAILGLLVFAVALAGVATNWWAGFYTFLGAFTYGVIYTVWLKRRTWTNIVVGGLAGSFAVLAGAAAVDPVLSTDAVLLAVVLFLWTPPHFWSLAMVSNDDYRQAGVPMLPVVAGPKLCAWVILAHTLVLSVISIIPFWYGMGTIYLIGALAGGGLFTWSSVALVIKPDRARAIKNFLASLLQLCLLLGGATADRVVGSML